MKLYYEELSKWYSLNLIWNINWKTKPKLPAFFGKLDNEEKLGGYSIITFVKMGKCSIYVVVSLQVSDKLVTSNEKK